MRRRKPPTLMGFLMTGMVMLATLVIMSHCKG